MNNAMIDLTSDLLRDHIEELMKGDWEAVRDEVALCYGCLLYTSPSPRDLSTSRMPSSA